jgi:predicted permease
MIWNPHRRRLLESLDLDFEDHLAGETAENIERGMPPDEARRAAVRAFGNVTLLKEQTRAVWSWVWFEQLMQDLRYALRMLRRNPGFTATAVLTLALCIGMNTAMFSVVNAVILQPLPYPDPDRLVWISDDCSGNGYHGSDDCFMSRGDFVLWKEQAHSIETMALVGHQDIALVYNGRATTERIGSIQGDFWSMLNARAALGHLFGPSKHDVVVLTWPLFERVFDGDPNVLGRTIELEGHVFVVAGVLTPEFRNLIPQALYPGDEILAITAYIPTIVGNRAPGDPLRATVQSGPTPAWFRMFGKRRSDVSFDQARAEMQTLFVRTWKQHPNPYGHHDKSKLRFETLTQRLIGRARPTLAILFAAVIFVLFIGIANIANLLLARASAREREIAIRVAVGAGGARVVRQFLAESVLLSIIGGAAGVGLAAVSLAAIKHIGSSALPRLEDAHINPSVLFFALVVSFCAGILFGLAPALSFARRSLDEALKHDAPGSSASSVQFRLRGLLVAAEVTLTTILLISAGLMLKSFQRMTAYPPGLEPNRILTMRISLAGPQYDRQWPQQSVYLQKLFDRLRKFPGVEAFGIDCGQLNQSLKVAGVRAPSESESGGAVRYVSAGYLKALGMPLLAGRWPTEDEMLGDALVNESFVRRVASSDDVVGRRMQGTLISANIAGVVADFKDFQLDIESQPQVYTAYPMIPVLREVRIALRTYGDPLPRAEGIRKAVAGIDNTVPVFQIQTLAQELYNSVSARRFNLALLAIFAGTALLLAIVGVFGVIAYLVARRTTEIGIRMALGAPRASILQMVVRQGMRMVLIGVAIGLLSAAGFTRVMSNMLYGVTPGDAPTFFLVAAIISLTALLACVGPALRAALVDPLIALRSR